MAYCMYVTTVIIVFSYFKCVVVHLGHNHVVVIVVVVVVVTL